MRLSLIVAVAENGAIGKQNDLPWHLPADLKRFKRITMGHPILMGRKTWESIGRPLPGRRSIVLSQSADFAPIGCEVVPSLDAAMALCQESDEAFVIGGARLFQLAAPMAHRLYLTRIHRPFDGDVTFPEWNWDEWTLVSNEHFPAEEPMNFAYSFQTFDRKLNAADR